MIFKTNLPTALVIEGIDWTCCWSYTLLVSCLTSRPRRMSSSTDWSWQLVCHLKYLITCCNCVTCAVVMATSLLPCHSACCYAIFALSMCFVCLLYYDGYKMSKRLKNYLDPTSGPRGQIGHVHPTSRTSLHSALQFYTPCSLRNYIPILVHLPFIINSWIHP